MVLCFNLCIGNASLPAQIQSLSQVFLLSEKRAFKHNMEADRTPSVCRVRATVLLAKQDLSFIQRYNNMYKLSREKSLGCPKNLLVSQHLANWLAFLFQQCLSFSLAALFPGFPSADTLHHHLPPPFLFGLGYRVLSQNRRAVPVVMELS